MKLFCNFGPTRRVLRSETLKFMDKKIIYLANSAQPVVRHSSANWSRVAGVDRTGIIESLAVLWLGGWTLFAAAACISQALALSI